MSIIEQQTGDITVLKVDGDLAGPNAEELRDLATRCLHDGRRDFIVDLSNANTCDSAGLEALIWLQTQCEDHLGLVKLVALNENITKVLEITRLDQRFDNEYTPY